MDRKKIIYIGSILLITVFVSVTYFSYAFFSSKNEYHGKVNMVVGTLDYKLSSSLLNNNSITLAANEKARLNIEVESLNEINSKYELYYTTTNNNIEIGYNTTNDLPTGTINSKSKKTVTVIIKNPSNTSATVTFGVQGGFTHNTLALESGKNSLTQIQSSYCEVAANTVFEYDYTGSGQEFEVPCSGNYKVELWGASGGIADQVEGGKGGYTAGNISLGNEKIFVYVGGEGSANEKNVISSSQGGYNGGGSSRSDSGFARVYASGGGATDIRTTGGTWDNFNSLKSRIMVAAGGGGAYTQPGDSWNSVGGNAGGLTGGDGNQIAHWGTTYCYGLGGSQDTGAAYTTNCTSSYSTKASINSGFGYGGSFEYSENFENGIPSTGGGGGYYGGGHSGHVASAGGGSSFISGYSGCNAIAGSSTSNNIIHTNQPNHYSGKVFTNAVMIHGKGCNWSTGSATNCGANQLQPDGTNATGHTGNGYARITFLSESTKEEKKSMLYKVIFNSNMSENVLFATDYTEYNATGFSQPNTMYQLKLDTAVEGLTLMKDFSELNNLPYAYKEGYLFDGWYTSKNGGTKITQLSDINSFMILYAHWTQTTYVKSNADVTLNGTNNYSRNDLFSNDKLNNIDKFVLSFDYVADSKNLFDVDTYGSYNNSTYEGPQVLPTATTYNQKFIWVVYHNSESMNGTYFRIFDDQPPYSTSSNKVYISNIKLYKY